MKHDSAFLSRLRSLIGHAMFGDDSDQHEKVNAEAPRADERAPQHAAKIPPASPPARAAGQFLHGSYACEAGGRDYRLYLPACYAGQPLPLLIMLHGCGQDAADFANGTRANSAADELGFIVAYPEQSRSANGSACWNWFRPEDQHAGAGEPAILAGIVDDIRSEYRVDETRIFVAGLSAGGAMAAILGLAYPQLFAAVGVHSGLPVGLAHDLGSALAAMRDGGKRAGALPWSSPVASPPPLVVFHGDADKTVHPRNAHRLITQYLAQRGARALPATTATRAGRTFMQKAFSDAHGARIAELWMVHGAGHAWSGGNADASYADARGPDATREMMRFFLAHPRHVSLTQRLNASLALLRPS